MNIIVELRAGEGGWDSKQIVEEQTRIYLRLAARRSL